MDTSYSHSGNWEPAVIEDHVSWSRDAACLSSDSALYVIAA